MDTKIYKLNADNPDISIIKKAAKILRNGGLVVFPTETVYGIACRAQSDALENLDQAKNRPSDKRYSLVIADKRDIDTYIPHIPLYATKIIDKYWPGPLTGVFELDKEDMTRQKELMGSEICDILYQDNSIGIRCPQGNVAKRLLKHCDFPVVAPSANLSGQNPAVNAQQALEQLDGRVDMILDCKISQYQKPSSVVKFSPFTPQMLRQGVVSKEDIEKTIKVNILFICTGNTCRSPMAEAICRKKISEKFGCELDQIKNFGYKVASAGVMAFPGSPPSQQAVDAMNTMSLDISSHCSSILNQELVEDSDVIFTLTNSHLDILLNNWEKADGKAFLLDKTGDIADPIGAGTEIYQACASQISKAITKRIGEFL